MLFLLTILRDGKQIFNNFVSQKCFHFGGRKYLWSRGTSKSWNLRVCRSVLVWIAWKVVCKVSDPDFIQSQIKIQPDRLTRNVIPQKIPSLIENPRDTPARKNWRWWSVPPEFPILQARISLDVPRNENICLDNDDWNYYKRSCPIPDGSGSEKTNLSTEKVRGVIVSLEVLKMLRKDRNAINNRFRAMIEGSSDMIASI
jgi:hypothetical protein